MSEQLGPWRGVYQPDYKIEFFRGGDPRARVRSYDASSITQITTSKTLQDISGSWQITIKDARARDAVHQMDAVKIWMKGHNTGWNIVMAGLVDEVAQVGQAAPDSASESVEITGRCMGKYLQVNSLFLAVWDVNSVLPTALTFGIGSPFNVSGLSKDNTLSQDTPRAIFDYIMDRFVFGKRSKVGESGIPNARFWLSTKKRFEKVPGADGKEWKVPFIQFNESTIDQALSALQVLGFTEAWVDEVGNVVFRHPQWDSPVAYKLSTNGIQGYQLAQSDVGLYTYVEVEPTGNPALSTSIGQALMAGRAPIPSSYIQAKGTTRLGRTAGRGLGPTASSASALTVKGQAMSALQIGWANLIMSIGRGMGASAIAQGTAVCEAIAESSMGIDMAWNPTYGGILAGNVHNFGSLGTPDSQAVGVAEINACYQGNLGYQAGGALVQTSTDLLQNAMNVSGSGTQFLGEAGHEVFAGEAVAIVAAGGGGVIPGGGGPGGQFVSTSGGTQGQTYNGALGGQFAAKEFIIDTDAHGNVTAKGRKNPWYKLQRAYGLRPLQISSPLLFSPEDAQKQAEGLLKFMSRFIKSGTITIPGETSLRIGNNIQIAGEFRGRKLNRTYYIEGVAHNYADGQGYTTTLQLTHGRDPWDPKWGEMVLPQFDPSQLAKTGGTLGQSSLVTPGPGGSSAVNTAGMANIAPGISPSAVATSGLGAYGASRSYGGHAGVDISMPEGTALHAIFDGTITSVQTNWYSSSNGKGQGEVGMVAASGTAYIYGHSDVHYVSVGQKVKAGQEICLSGAPGGGPHLHFAINTGGIASGNGNIDPTQIAIASLSI